VSQPDRGDLIGQWVHSHEEDSDDEAVFRPSAYSLPPARGRRSFDLRPDGTYVEVSPGPVDVPEESAGRWSLEGDRLVLRPGKDGEEVWCVTTTGSDRLQLRRVED
jgi:hypothetical protein